MKPSYQGNAKPFVLVLYHAADAPAVLPVLEELESKGLNLSHRQDRRVKRSVIQRACSVIAFLSATSIADQRMEDAILLTKAMNVPLVCVNLDQTQLHDSMNRLLYASNIIFAGRYQTPASLGERILTAESLLHPALTKAQIEATRRMALVLMTGALLIVAAAGLLIWQRIDAAAKAKEVVVQQEEPADIGGLLSSGMTEEDLQKIRTLILVGDQLIDANKLDYSRDWSQVVTEMHIDDKTVWSMEGKEIPRGTVTDISLIGRMSNLQTLILLNQSVTDLSPIASLTKLNYIEISDCPVESLEALSGMTNLLELTLTKTEVTSLAPLSGCTLLQRFTGTIEHCNSIEGLGLSSLKNLTLFDTIHLTNLDPLAACNGLTSLEIYGAENLVDASGLAGCTALNALQIQDATSLRSCAGLSETSNLERVVFYNVGIRDLSPLRQSRGLKELMLEEVPIHDLSWTSGMNQLNLVNLHGTNLRDLNFLKELGVSTLVLHFSGDIEDYSGLAAIPNYDEMHLNPRNQNLAAVLPYIVDATFSTLWLYDCNGIDFSTLPQQVYHLWITSGNLTNLEGISVLPKLNELTLERMNRLSSLDGLAGSESLLRIKVTDCARLADYEDLYQRSYTVIELEDLPVAPDLARLQMMEFGSLTLDSMPCITDLSPLEACQTTMNMLELRNMTEIGDLSPLKNMQVRSLIVPPQLEEQAAQLREEHFIDTYNVYYPEDTLWAEEEGGFTLLSLEELDTLPDSLLGRVNELTIIGDQLLDPSTQVWTDQWDEDGQHFFLVDRVSEELSPVGPGVIERIEQLGKLTGLESLCLCDQPLTSLQGIQAFSELRYLNFSKCPIEDAAPMFTLTQLEEMALFDANISSIQGIQNLTKLRRIDINDSLVTDLSPLKDCDFGYAMENGGLQLYLNSIPCQDFSAFSSIEAFAHLSMDGHDAALWLPYLAGRTVNILDANHCSLRNEQIAAIAAIPQLRELQVCWNEQITDLSPLLACPTLEKVVVNSYSTEALASIEGKAHFTIEYRD